MQHAMANLNLQAPVPTLLTLPAELLIEISRHFCIHCRHPRIGEIPHDEAATAIHDQITLANLTASSKYLRAIAQPILFHFFHSVAVEIDTRRRLASFARTLIHRPDLAASVRSLILWAPNDDGLLSLTHEQRVVMANKDVDRKTLARAAETLGPWWVGRQYASLTALQELTIALASEATYVLLQRSFMGFSPAKTWRDWTHPMDNLRHVVLVGWRYRWRRNWYTYHLKEARALLRHARNLESLVVVECGGDGVSDFVTGRDELKALPWDVQLPWLRKLSINGENVGTQEVEAIIRHSTVFEDLEFFEGGVVWGREALDLERHLGTTKKTLKRLCYSAFPIKATLRESDVCHESYEMSDEDREEDWFDPVWHGLSGFEVGFSLKAFSALETLELEQLVLYGPVFEEPDKVESDRSCEAVTTEEFLAKFPPSLMHLRMGCIFYWPIVFRDLLAMAEERARFPKLRSVTLEVRRIPPREEFDCLVAAFRKAGTALSICSVSGFPSRCLTLELGSRAYTGEDNFRNLEVCFDIQENYLLKRRDIEKFNQKKTWKFTKCQEMKENMIFCIRDGDPPMPASIHNAFGGPQKLSTIRPTNGTKLADLNPCPLNVCCNTWNQCGITKDFRVDTTADIAKVVDYLVFMTYDLHGQWDVNNKDAAEGCELGNGLRSHINKTQTENSLDMTTKAGVPSYKVFVGISSYGRSFKMAEPGCDGVLCLYLGGRNQSPAAPGYCTNTSGYISDAEIRQIKKIYDSIGGEYYEYDDEDSDSDVLVYDLTEWVAYMDHETKERRVQWYKDLNFGGISDWAVDLQAEGKANSGLSLDIEAMDLSCELKDDDNLDDVIRDADKSSEECVAMNAIGALQRMLVGSMSSYDEAASSYEDIFGFYRDYMHDTLGERLRAMTLDGDQPIAGFFDCFYTKGELGNREDATKYDGKDPPNAYMQPYTFFWDLCDRDGLNNTLSTKGGIDLEWVEFGEYNKEFRCEQTSGGTGSCFNFEDVHWGFPTAKSDFEVPNPKTVVEEARKNFDTIMSQNDNMYTMLGLDLFVGSPADAVEVLAMPVFLLTDAVEVMKKVKKIAQKERERRAKELILKILEGILFLIPFVGAAIGGLGRTDAMMARMLMAVDAIGSGGLAVYSLVENPEMAPVAMLVMLLGGVGAGGSRGALRYRELSIAKGKLSPEQKNNLGASFRLHNPKVETLMARICPRR